MQNAECRIFAITDTVKIETYRTSYFQIFDHKHIWVTQTHNPEGIFVKTCQCFSLQVLSPPTCFHINPKQMQTKRGVKNALIRSLPPLYRHRFGWSHRAGRWRRPSGSCPPQTRPPGTRSAPPSSGRRRSCSPAPSSWTTGLHPPNRGGQAKDSGQTLRLKVTITNLLHTSFRFHPPVCVYLFTQVEVDGPDWPAGVLVLVVLQNVGLPAQPTTSQHEPAPLPRLGIVWEKKRKVKNCFSSLASFS